MSIVAIASAVAPTIAPIAGAIFQGSAKVVVAQTMMKTAIVVTAIFAGTALAGLAMVLHARSRGIPTEDIVDATKTVVTEGFATVRTVGQV